MRRSIALAGADARRSSRDENRNGRAAAMPSSHFWIRFQYLRACLAPQVEYLNSGIAFNSSLVALNTAWSGYQGLGFDMVAVAGGVFVFAAPVVVDDAGRLPPAGRFALAPV